MKKIDSPEQLQQMIAALEKESFYGELRLTFRNGVLKRMVTEESQVFDSNTKGRDPNDRQFGR